MSDDGGDREGCSSDSDGSSSTATTVAYERFADNFYSSYLPYNYGGPRFDSDSERDSDADPDADPDSNSDAGSDVDADPDSDSERRPLMINFALYPRRRRGQRLDMTRARDVFMQWVTLQVNLGRIHPCPRSSVSCASCGINTSAFVLWTRRHGGVIDDVVRQCIVCHELPAYPLRPKLFKDVVGGRLEGEWFAWWCASDDFERVATFCSERQCVFGEHVDDSEHLYYELLRAVLDDLADPFTRMRDFLEARAANRIKRWLRFRLEEYSLRPGNAGAKKVEAHFYDIVRDLR